MGTWVYQWTYRIVSGTVVFRLLRWNWRPVDVFLLLMAFGVVVSIVEHRAFPPLRIWAIRAAILIGGVLVTSTRCEVRPRGG